jgi:hypothetical protein
LKIDRWKTAFEIGTRKPRKSETDPRSASVGNGRFQEVQPKIFEDSVAMTTIQTRRPAPTEGDEMVTFGGKFS